MRVLLQRVSRAEVRVGGRVTGSIGTGFLLLTGFTHADTPEQAVWMADKIVGLRLFADADEKMNLGLADVGGALLVVSQFTLYADTRRGRRPGFSGAAPPDHAEAIYRRFCLALERTGTQVERGRFGAPMDVELVNDGPFTIWLDSADR